MPSSLCVFSLPSFGHYHSRSRLRGIKRDVDKEDLFLAYRCDFAMLASTAAQRCACSRDHQPLEHAIIDEFVLSSS